MKRIVHKIGYNTQRDNEDFDNAFPGSKQCFSTAAYMLLSFISPVIHKAEDDNMLASYVRDASDVVDKTGTGAEMDKKNNYTVNSAYFWEVHKKIIENIMHVENKFGRMIYRDASATWEMLYSALESGPVILGTNKLGGLPGGHIILAIGHEANGDLICHDPYGDANTRYKNINGQSVVYSREFLEPAIGKTKIRMMHWQGA